jgi:phosphoribosylformylglycinamidine synthase
MKVAIVEFPGSYGVKEIELLYRKYFSQEVVKVWHKAEVIPQADLLILAGGASFADYLRPGALAKSTRIAPAIRKFANSGASVLGIGNGFQILCELDILPGVLLINQNCIFRNDKTFLLCERNDIRFTKNISTEEPMQMPISCKYGRYYATKRVLNDIEENGQVVFRYCDRFGEIEDKDFSFNGCANSIAAVTNKSGNVMGMMPRPERTLNSLPDEIPAGLSIFKQ